MISHSTLQWLDSDGKTDEPSPFWFVGAEDCDEWVCHMCLNLRQSEDLDLCACDGFHSADCADFALCSDRGVRLQDAKEL
jgi:hypothetical protein